MASGALRLTFLLVFLALWGLISFTIIFRKEEETPRELTQVLDHKALRYIPKLTHTSFSIAGSAGTASLAQWDQLSKLGQPAQPDSANQQTEEYSGRQFESRHPDLVYNGSLPREARALAQRVADLRADLGSQIQPGIPIIQQKKYRRIQANIRWQQEEINRHYSGATHSRLHGILEPDYGTAWIGSLKKPLNPITRDIRPRGCSDIKYDTLSIAPVSVIIIFCNEWPELLLRSVHSVLNTSPPELLKEIILVDDLSDEPELVPVEYGGAGHLQEYIKGLPKTKYVRLHERQGIVGARLRGIHEATADNFIILDSHIEAVGGWLEPLAWKMTVDPRSFVMPVIDGIDADTYEPREGGIGCTLGMIWKLMEHGMTPNIKNPKRMGVKPTEWQTSPTHAGGLFGANIEMFFDIGGYDPGMSHWGTENIELSFRLWQCGATLECTECSHVHHLFGGRKRWRAPGGTTTNNKVRTLAVWMDRYADLSYMILGRPAQRISSIQDRLEMRKQLQCHDFQWFLDNVWPESYVTDLTRDVPFAGAIQSKSLPNVCIGRSRSLTGSCDYAWMYFSQIEVIHPTTDDEYCITHNGNTFWSSEWCLEGNYRGQRFKVQVITDVNPSTAVVTLKHLDEGKCVTALSTSQIGFENCDPENEAQQWLWDYYNPPQTFTPPT